MISLTKEVYLSTRKRHDLLFNSYVMRPLAAAVVAAIARTGVTPNQVTLLGLAIFVAGIGLLPALPTLGGGVIAVAVCELGYLFDCVDGMLARHKKLASVQGHLFDFFTDELKAVLLAGAIGVRLWRTGGWSIDLAVRSAGDPLFLLAAVAGVTIIASAISLTNFVRRPELSGRQTSVEAYYETVDQIATHSVAGWLRVQLVTFLRFLNHYPSHLWLFALLGRLDLFFWIWLAINLLYLGRGWLGLLLRFARPHADPK